MKIVMICDFYNEDLEYQENLLVRYYVKYRHEVIVVTSTFDSVFDYYGDRHDKHAPARTYIDRGAKIVKLKYRYNFLNRLRALTSIDKLLEQEAPDLIYVHDIMPNLLEAIRYVKRNPGCRMIMDYHADYSNSGKNALSLKVLHGVIRKWFLDRARPYISKIFPIVPAGALFLHEIYKVPYADMELLPLGGDVDFGQKVRSQRQGALLRTRFNIPEDDLVIFTGGKLTPLKRTELLIAVFQRLARQNLHLFVIGETGEGEEAYKQILLDASADNPQIHFVGWLSSHDIYAYLDMADIAVFPASQSILWQQAISMHLPLIVGSARGQEISYLNQHGNIIILKDEQINEEALYASLKEVVDDSAKRQAMSDGAALVTDESLNWNTLINRTLRYNLTPNSTTDPESDPTTPETPCAK